MKKNLKRAILAIVMVMLLVMPATTTQAAGISGGFFLQRYGSDWGMSGEGVVINILENGEVIETLDDWFAGMRFFETEAESGVTWVLASYPAGYVPDVLSGVLQPGIINNIIITFTPTTEPPPVEARLNVSASVGDTPLAGVIFRALVDGNVVAMLTTGENGQATTTVPHSIDDITLELYSYPDGYRHVGTDIPGGDGVLSMNALFERGSGNGGNIGHDIWLSVIILGGETVVVNGQELVIPIDLMRPIGTSVLILYQDGEEIGRSGGGDPIGVGIPYQGFFWGSELIVSGRISQSPSESGTFTWRIEFPDDFVVLEGTLSGEANFTYRSGTYYYRISNILVGENGDTNGETTYGLRFQAIILFCNLEEYGAYEIFVPTDWYWPWGDPVLVLYHDGVEIGRSGGFTFVPTPVYGIDFGVRLAIEVRNLPQSPSEMGTFTWRIIPPTGPNLVWFPATSGEFDFVGASPVEELGGLYFRTLGLLYVAEREGTNGNGENGNGGGDNGNGENGNGENGNGENGGGGAGERPAPQTGVVQDSFMLSGLLAALSMVFGIIAVKKKRSA